MTHYAGAQPALRPIHRLVLALCALVGLAFPLSTPGSSVVHAGFHVYDESATFPVDARKVGAVGAGVLRIGDAQSPSASPSMAVRGSSTTSPVAFVATNTVDDVVGSVKPWDLQRTETLVGRGSQAKVDDIAASMRENGWVGDPIEVFQANGQNYIVNGHHRVAAARQAGVDVQYRVISQTELLTYYPGGVNQLVSAASEARPGRVR